MPDRGFERIRLLSCRAYSWLLLLYPAGLRADYGSEMQAVFREQVRDAYIERGLLGFAGIWWRVAVEVIEGVWPAEIDWLRFGIPVASLVSSFVALMVFLWASGAMRHCAK
jgi:hypothetical protein